MKVVAGMLTHNAVSTGRLELAKETAWSLASEADELLVLDNASTDGTDEWVRSIGGFCYRPADGNHTTGRGMNHLATACARRADGGVIVPTADDMYWRPGWRSTIEAFWEDAPDKVAILCGLLEPDYPWSSPIGAMTCGGVTALIRPTVPGGGWTIRSRDWLRFVGPLPEVKGHDDVPTCRRLISQGWVLAAVDVAEHRGEHLSLWGNASWQWAKPLDTHGVAVTSNRASTIGDTDVATRGQE